MMTNMLFTGIVDMFKRKNTKEKSNMMTWAKTEYGRDWQFAYNYMLDTGMAPTEKDLKGITL